LEKSGYKFLGILSKLHGFKGEYLFITENDLPKNTKKWESVFVEIDGLPIPFFISSLRIISENSAYISFKDVETPDEMNELVGCNVLQTAHLAGKDQKRSDVTGLEGFQMIDIHKGPVGIIDSIIEYSQNVLFRVLANDNEILVPAIDAYIKKVDVKKKELYIEAPDGLLDLNVR
jgi:16S rRNA processing protein RimM